MRATSGHPRRSERLEWPPLGHRAAVLLLIVASGASCRSASQEPAGPIIQPGRPGEPSRAIRATQAADLSQLRYSAEEARFMQRMIAHHAQALEMTALLAARTSREDMQLLGRRIHLSQADEIQMMREWLHVRGVPVSNEDGPHAHDGAVMPGMLTAEEMRRLAEATGSEVDRLFLELMIKHHGGALIMVDELFATPGAGQQSEIFTFASEVEADQRIEIDRMRVMLEERMR
jgi:uncharacterized protein (DUF305 family)